MRETRVLQMSPAMPGQDDPDDPLAANESTFIDAVEAAGQLDPDFVNFPELHLASDTNRSNRPLTEIAHELPGEFTDRVASAAAAIDSYVWVPTYEKRDGNVYNSVALIDPEEGYRGAYSKVAPTIGELENRGVSPGRELPVWDTEFGRVAATICWDVQFDDIALGYRAKEIDLMFHPTHGLGQGKFAHWATYHGFHVAYCFPSEFKVFTPPGNVVGQDTGHPTMAEIEIGEDSSSRASLATINTDMESYDMGSFDYGDSELTELRRAYPDTVEIHSCHKDAVIVVESRHPEKSIEDLEAEFDLPTKEWAERRTRELVADAGGESPLLGPEAFPTERRRDVPARTDD